MEMRVGKYVLKPISEEEAKRVMEDQKSKELEMLWNILHDNDGEALSEAHHALWLNMILTFE